MELRGRGVSPGIAAGPALLVERHARSVLRLVLDADMVPREAERLERALSESRRQLERIKTRLQREVGTSHAYIFDAHLLMLDDPLLRERSRALVREQRVNAEWAVTTAAAELHALFEPLEDAYLRERRSDIDDVVGRVLLNLGGGEDAPSLSRLLGRFVVVASGLAPSEAAELDWPNVVGIVTETGSHTDHTAILARSLGIPCVVGVPKVPARIEAGALVVVDGTTGVVAVEPSAVALARVKAAQQRDQAERERLQRTRGLAAVTRDGVAVRLLANVEFPDEVATALDYGAEGIGLFRSEYLLGRARRWPSEEQQLRVYLGLVEKVRPRPVTIRTWDVGVEDVVPGGPSSANPALGDRAWRLVRHDPDPFRTQVRAVLRAGVGGEVRLLLPFIGGRAELDAALGLVEQAKAELVREGVPFALDVPVGINIEVPSAALTADLLARRVQFLTLGTNDLVQFLLAVDRSDPRLSAFYEPLHPAVLRAIRFVVQAGESAGVPVTVCGEMAAEPLHALLLLGLGVRELSLGPAGIPRVKAAVRGASIRSARQVAEAALDMATPAEIEGVLRRELADALDAFVAAKRDD